MKTKGGDFLDSFYSFYVVSSSVSQKKTIKRPTDSKHGGAQYLSGRLFWMRQDVPCADPENVLRGGGSKFPVGV